MLLKLNYEYQINEHQSNKVKYMDKFFCSVEFMSINLNMLIGGMYLGYLIFCVNQICRIVHNGPDWMVEDLLYGGPWPEVQGGVLQREIVSNLQ